LKSRAARQDSSSCFWAYDLQWIVNKSYWIKVVVKLLY
jgi:hypothetical protein